MKQNRIRKYILGNVVCASMLCSSLYSGNFKVVDTGQSKSFNNTTEINAPSSGERFYGQDAQFDANQPSYTLSADGLTVFDNNTGLTWLKSPDTDGDGDIDTDDKLSYDDAMDYAEALNSENFGGYSDWRVPDIKELYSLMDFTGLDPSDYVGSDTSSLTPFIDTDYFDFAYGDQDAGERIIDAQFISSTKYVSTTMNGDETVFGANLADGRIKGYPVSMRGQDNSYYTICVRGNTSFSQSSFSDNDDFTITDSATGLMWTQNDSGEGLNWEEALAWVESQNASDYLGHNDWRLPNIKELQSIVDYSRSPDTTNSAAIDAVFNCTSITNESGEIDYPYFWSSTTHQSSNGIGANAAYIAFGRAMGYMNGSWMDVHGAGCQRSDPKSGDPDDYPTGRGPQGDAIRIYNYVRLVRDAEIAATPEIEVSHNSTDIVDGIGSINFGSTSIGTSITKTFIITNVGESDLNLGSSLTVPAGFSVAHSFSSKTLPPGASTSFTIKFDADTAGNYSGTLSFSNNDSDENPFDFTIAGTVNAADDNGDDSDPIEMDDSDFSYGAIFTVNASDLDLDPFTKKPQIYAYINGKKKKLGIVETINKNTTTNTVNAYWKCKYKIYNKKTYKSVELSSALAANPIDDLKLDSVFLKTTDGAIRLSNNSYLRCPVITSVDTIPVTAQDEFILSGKYFGSKCPKVSIEYYKNGDITKPAYKRCKVIKGESLIYSDAKNKVNSSCMKIYENDQDSQDVNYSQVKAVYPNLPDQHTPTGYVILDNGIGLAAFKLKNN